ncbi:DUF1932 domain-containing protein [Quisquiliibacterium transsilvanicum]|uniref:3-hydroxyisobutyrate dehydrogenase-like beta-hydroxyacid dehydrogenase n=1 Tax=Quisquiliibacterium transsilvanicum TaxID=1549638 RepID=A0A7W8HHY3_9BURK|nr:DUF1932 domain-containing protein [Quisquiliibacterium transsilvanicum]MBB5272197.1 3-hydroxyisobutyrate dehydrogenase-like beta-hydroxyacid dehydrogenase [Quisquiliibacterium transsilvanicum]
MPENSGMASAAAPAVGFLHPGEMGAALAALTRANGHRALWASAGRSAGTGVRARAAGLADCGTLPALCAQSGILVSICPPHAALELARAVAAEGYRGIYVDANAISPRHAREIAGIVAAAGAEFVDAAVVGPPPLRGRDTRLYLSGPSAAAVAACFPADRLILELVGAEPGRASAIKSFHSSMHKGSLALLFATLAAAEGAGVRAELERLFASRPATAAYLDGLDGSVRRASKSWRFAGEMDEVADALGEFGLPRGFHAAAAEIYRRLAGLRGAASEVELAAVLDSLLGERGR